jgi:hypothetical protein
LFTLLFLPDDGKRIAKLEKREVVDQLVGHAKHRHRPPMIHGLPKNAIFEEVSNTALAEASGTRRSDDWLRDAAAEHGTVRRCPTRRLQAGWTIPCAGCNIRNERRKTLLGIFSGAS